MSKITRPASSKVELAAPAPAGGAADTAADVMAQGKMIREDTAALVETAETVAPAPAPAPATVAHVIDLYLAYGVSGKALDDAQRAEIGAFETSALATWYALEHKIGGPDTAKTIATAAGVAKREIEARGDNVPRGLYAAKPSVLAHGRAGAIFALPGDLPKGVHPSKVQKCFTEQLKLATGKEKLVGVSETQLKVILDSAFTSAAAYKALVEQVRTNIQKLLDAQGATEGEGEGEGETAETAEGLTTAEHIAAALASLTAACSAYDATADLTEESIEALAEMAEILRGWVSAETLAEVAA